MAPLDDPWHQPPTPVEVAEEMRTMRASAPSRVTRPPYDLAEAQAALGPRLADRDAAAARVRELEANCESADTVLETTQVALATFDGLADRVADHYAGQIAAGTPPALSPELRAENAAHRDAKDRLDAIHAAHQRLQRDLAAARAELENAENEAAKAVVEVLRCQGEGIADKVSELRCDLEVLRREMVNLGGVNLCGSRVTYSHFALSQVRDPLPEPTMTSGIQEWMAKARAMMAHGV